MKDIYGKHLKRARHVEDMTQEEVAELLGIHRSYLSQIENEKVIPSPKLQEKINNLFKRAANNFLFTECYY